MTCNVCVGLEVFHDETVNVSIIDGYVGHFFQRL